MGRKDKQLLTPLADVAKQHIKEVVSVERWHLTSTQGPCNFGQAIYDMVKKGGLTCRHFCRRVGWFVFASVESGCVLAVKDGDEK